MKPSEIQIDREFHALIPPPSDEERDQLEQLIKAEGCRDPLVTWGGILLDGHNRKEICERNGIKFAAVALDLADRNAALAWVIRNQFGRRNLNNYQRAELALKLEPLIAAKAKENQKRGGGSGTSGRQNSDNPTDTKKELARTAGVSHDTIAKAKVLADKAPEPVKKMLRDGEVSINAAYNAVANKRERQKPEPDSEDDVDPDTGKPFPPLPPGSMHEEAANNPELRASRLLGNIRGAVISLRDNGILRDLKGCSQMVRSRTAKSIQSVITDLKEFCEELENADDETNAHSHRPARRRVG